VRFTVARGRCYQAFQCRIGEAGRPNGSCCVLLAFVACGTTSNPSAPRQSPADDAGAIMSTIRQVLRLCWDRSTTAPRFVDVFGGAAVDNGYGEMAGAGKNIR